MVSLLLLFTQQILDKVQHEVLVFPCKTLLNCTFTHFRCILIRTYPHTTYNTTQHVFICVIYLLDDALECSFIYDNKRSDFSPRYYQSAIVSGLISPPHSCFESGANLLLLAKERYCSNAKMSSSLSSASALNEPFMMLCSTASVLVKPII